MTHFGQVLQTVALHLLDILILSYLIYRVLLLIRGTRAVQVLFGLLFLFLLTLLVRDFLHLPATTWLLDKFWATGVLILVVVFQPEIRSALAQLGSHRLGHFILRKELFFIDEIIATLKECSERRIGSLIVLEQEIGLRNFIETGIIINGEVSKELLLSIFNNHSPLHDGAVIVEGTRVIAAACLLPLTNEPGIAKILGTRHRAAVGLSNISDALVFVVSEETGIISLARAGKLERDLDPAELRKRLIKLYRERAARGLLRQSGEEDKPDEEKN